MIRKNTAGEGQSCPRLVLAEALSLVPQALDAADGEESFARGLPAWRYLKEHGAETDNAVRLDTVAWRNIVDAEGLGEEAWEKMTKKERRRGGKFRNRRTEERGLPR
ncbi:hypothetical protein [Aminivibrio sp.]|jgi:hypothetical protein|uniref:hypothetical protein n=1 Tax=Aminivibrio sp. TaxID=1872489 RepID=UPI001A5A7A87|nr:hypothetical protein [Aminivibrio sp.]MBL3540475.1 hypothetical protein [Aminivibrio sp.]